MVGGFSGLWTALLAKERDPGLDVVVLEGRGRLGGVRRNGGFCAASLTHGSARRAAVPRRDRSLERLGAANLDAIEQTLLRYGIDCGSRAHRGADCRHRSWQVAELLAGADEPGASWLDQDAVRAELHSPTFLGGLERDRCALVDPARLAWGWPTPAGRWGTIYEGSGSAGYGRWGRRCDCPLWTER